MSREKRELRQLYATVEGVELSDPDAQRLAVEHHANDGSIVSYELELGEKVISERYHYVPLFKRVDEERRTLQQVLAFKPDAVIKRNKVLPSEAVIKPREDIVSPRIWQEHKHDRDWRYGAIGAIATGLTAGAIITVHKWRKRQSR